MPSSNPYLNGYDDWAKTHRPKPVPRPRRPITKRKKPNNRKKKNEQARGKEITVRSTDQERQIVYGRYALAGVITFVKTVGQYAEKTFGSGNSRIHFKAVKQGVEGNFIQVRFIQSGNSTPLSVTSTIDATQSPPTYNIVVRLRTNSSGAMISTVDQVINAIRADTEAMSWVTVDRGSGNGTGIVQPLALSPLENGSSAYLHLVLTLSGHKIHSIEEVYFGKERVFFHPQTPYWFGWADAGDTEWSKHFVDDKGNNRYLAFAVWTNGDDDQPAIGDLLGQSQANFPANQQWTVDHRQRGCAWMYMILQWYEPVYPEGLPEFTFIAHGKEVYDPRNDQTYFSANAALVIADYLTDTRYGMSIPWEEIDLDDLINSANVCDEQVSLATGGAESRYTINGQFDTGASPSDILEQFAASMAGDIVFQAGKWRILAGAWRAPDEAIILTEDDFRGPIKVQAQAARKDRFNRVRGQYIEPSVNYEPSDFPAVTNALYLSEDGEEVWEELTYNFVTSKATAQRLAKIELERIRQGIVVQVRASLKALQLLVGDNVYVTIEKYGWHRKTFEVRELQLSNDAETGLEIDLTLEESAPGIFDWNGGEETTYDLAPNTDLPSPFTATNPSNLVLSSGTAELYIRADGTVFTRLKASWQAPSDNFILSGGTYEIEYKRSADAVWSRLPEVPGFQEFTYILDVQDGVYYDVRIRSKNSIGYSAPDWVYAFGHKVIGKTEPPSDVARFFGEVGDFGILLKWTPVPDLDLSHYLIKLGDTWNSAAVVAEVRGTSYLIATQRAATYNFLIKAIDTSGNESLNATSLEAIIVGPDAPVTTFFLEGPDLILRWTPPRSNFAIAEYEVSYFQVTLSDNGVSQPSYEASIPLASTKGTTYRTKVNWNGQRTFYVVVRDIAGNASPPYRVDVMITAPGPVQNIRPDVIDNNVLLRWSPPATGSLPIAGYRVYKGDSYPVAILVGEVGGTFSVIFELVAGHFTYWIIAFDTAGNQSPQASVTVAVSEPPDFVIKTDGLLDPVQANLLSNVYVEGFGFGATSVDTGVIGTPLGILVAITTSGGTTGGGGGGGGGSTAGTPLGILTTVTKST